MIKNTNSEVQNDAINKLLETKNLISGRQYDAIRKKFGYTFEEVARAIGKSKSYAQSLCYKQEIPTRYLDLILDLFINNRPENAVQILLVIEKMSAPRT